MNEKYIHGTIIAMLVLGLLLMGASSYFLKQELRSVAVSLKNIEQGIADIKATPTATTPHTIEAEGGRIGIEFYCDAKGANVCFNLPRTWVVSQYDDQFTSGQKNTQIASDDLGVRVTVEKLQEGQQGMKGAKVEGYENLYELGEMCDGETCPHEQYFLSFVDGSMFAIRAHYDWADRNQLRQFIDVILTSLAPVGYSTR